MTWIFDVLLIVPRFQRFCSVIFQSIFFLFMKVGNLFHFLYSFTDPFFCFLPCALELPHWVLFCQLLCFSILIFPLHSSLYCVSLCWSFSFFKMFYISFVLSVFQILLWSIFMATALKHLSDNSNISVILVLTSVHCFLAFSYRSFWFLIW